MKVILAEHFGMCFGVRDAIAQAEELAANAPLTILGQLVHNPVVRERLRAAGIEELASMAPGSRQPSTQASLKRRVMITAHGISDSRREQLEGLRLELSDGTCPLVRQAHAHLKQLVCEGYFPIVIGLPDHVEVRGLTEDFGCAVVINEPADISKLPKASRFGVISQTTQPIDRVLFLVEQIRRARPAAEVRFVDTVCKPTKDRQRALKQLLETADTVVVIGGRTSNNTRELVQTCRAAGRRIIHIERADELQAADFAEAEVVGVTAGTSTLPETVSEVLAHLNRMGATR
jgi:4-hydroxy-3-methylbut-2-en-1-yl diphosphate reductase